MNVQILRKSVAAAAVWFDLGVGDGRQVATVVALRALLWFRVVARQNVPEMILAVWMPLNLRAMRCRPNSCIP